MHIIEIARARAKHNDNMKQIEIRIIRATYDFATSLATYINRRQECVTAMDDILSLVRHTNNDSSPLADHPYTTLDRFIVAEQTTQSSHFISLKYTLDGCLVICEVGGETYTITEKEFYPDLDSKGRPLPHKVLRRFEQPLQVPFFITEYNVCQGLTPQLWLPRELETKLEEVYALINQLKEGEREGI